MYGLFARNALVVGATGAAMLLAVQLRSGGGVAGYEPADVLSILLVAVPVATRSVRQPQRRRVQRPPDGGTGTAGTPSSPPERPGRVDPETAQAIELLCMRGLAVVVAGGAWLLAVVLVLLQAWAPAASALIVFGIAAGGLQVHPEEVPVASPQDNGAA